MRNSQGSLGFLAFAPERMVQMDLLKHESQKKSFSGRLNEFIFFDVEFKDS